MDGSTHNFQLLEPASPEALLPVGGWWHGWAVAALAALVVVALAWWWRRRRSAAGFLTIRNAAYAEAVAALARVTTDDVRDAAVQASFILRRYLAVAAGDPALYESHEEFILRRDVLPALAAADRAAAAAGFSRLAAMKYAPEIPAAAVPDVIAQCRELLENLHTGLAA